MSEGCTSTVASYKLVLGHIIQQSICTWPTLVFPHCTVPFYSLCSVSHVTVSNLFGAHVPKKLLLPKQYIRMMKTEVQNACIISVDVSFFD